jgi:hypothetical protein
MTTDELDGPTHRAWAHFRFSVVGPLLSCPPPLGHGAHGN